MVEIYQQKREEQQTQKSELKITGKIIYGGGKGGNSNKTVDDRFQ